MSKKIMDTLREWRADPVKFVEDNFGATPDAWQATALKAFPSNQRLAFVASKGVGKTTLLAWCIWNFLSTRPNAKIACTSISFDNLADGLRSELAFWQAKSPFLKARFHLTKTRISFISEKGGLSESWFCSFRAWSKSADASQQADALAGLHADYIMFICDEVGSYPPAIIATAEAALASGIETKLLVVGNPTDVNGPLYKITHEDRKNWHVQHINSDPENPERSPRVSIEWSQKQIDTYGRNSAWVKVNVLGEFPDQGSNNLFDRDSLREATNRTPTPDTYQYHQKRMGVDVARFGDDSTVLFPRQGKVAFNPVIMRGARTQEIVTRIMMGVEGWGSEVEYVDGTGGFGAGVVDGLIGLGRTPFEIHFSAKANDPRYANIRSEMYFNLAKWIKSGGSIPNIPELIEELSEHTYSFNKQDKLIIEPKEHIKERLGRSPDCFIGETLIKTPKGYKRLDSFKVGDLVSTPYGTTKVMKVWESIAETVTFTRGKYSLTGKPNHTVFTFNKGWTRLDCLKDTDVLELDTLISRGKWWVLNLLYMKDKNIEFKAQVDIISQTGRIKKRDFYTGLSGFNIMGRYLKDIMSTIKTMIGGITRLRILSLLKLVNIGRTISKKDGVLTGKQCCLYLKRLAKKLLFGTVVRKGLNGIQSMVRELGRIENLRSLPVFGAKKNLKDSLIEQSFVVNHAKQNNTIKITKSNTRVSSAGRSQPNTNTQKEPIAQEVVQTKTETVYNLTLESHNIYYANKILVSNCADALALTFATPDQVSNPLYDKSGLGQGKLLHEYDPLAD
jgi:phage terminase large subunit